jgi:hypothetical protein
VRAETEADSRRDGTDRSSAIPVSLVLGRLDVLILYRFVLSYLVSGKL